MRWFSIHHFKQTFDTGLELDLLQELIKFQRKPKELVNMFSEALEIMDRNTVKYMMEEREEKIRQLTGELEEQAGKLEHMAGENEQLVGKVRQQDSKLQLQAEKIDELMKRIDQIEAKDRG